MVNYRVRGLALSLLLVVSLSMMDFKFPLVFGKACQFKLCDLLVGVVCNDHFRAKGVVNGFEDVEVALGYGANLMHFSIILGASKVAFAPMTSVVSLLLSPSMGVSVLIGSWFEESAIVG